MRSLTYVSNRQMDFFDLNVYDLSRQQIYEKLADLAQQVGVDKSAVLALLARKPSDEFLNTGNAVTDECKVHIRIARQTSIHVSPTCVWNGLIENAISSGWTGEQWSEFFAQKVGGAKI